MSLMSSTLLPPKALPYCISSCQDAKQQLEHLTDSHARRVTMWVAGACIVLVPAIVVRTRGVERLHSEVFEEKVSYLRPLSLLKMLFS